MPELPEVEIVRKSLNKKISGKIINEVRVKNRNLRLKIPKNFEIKLKRKKIKKIGRFSKYIIIFFDDNSYCLIHLGMSGTIHLLNTYSKKKFTNTSFYHSPHLPKKHNHVEIRFKDLILVYNDPRRFGYILFINSKKELLKKFEKFGPEPFSKNFNTYYVKTYFSNKKKNIKNLLLDQNFVSGIGNIYASEILFFCKINPFKKVKLLSKKECRKIIINSRKILLKAISKGGSSIRDFKDTSGLKGGFQNEFKVYQQEGVQCKNIRCSDIIRKKIISNRSTFFCDSCQK